MIHSLLGIPSLVLVHRQMLAGMPGVHRRFYDAGASYEVSSLHDTFYALPTGLVSALVSIAFPLVLGLLLILTSRPLANLLSRGLDSKPDDTVA